MAVIKDFGVVLREYDAGENNKKLIVLTRDNGKLTVFARGARRQGSKLAVSLFSYNEFVIYDGGQFYSLNSVLPVFMFADISQDYDKFCYGCCFLEMADKMVLASMDTSAILDVLLMALMELTRPRHAPTTIFAVYAIKLLQSEGFAPLIDDSAGASTVQTGDSTITLCHQALQALTYILDSGARQMYDFKLSDDVASQLYRISRLMVAENVDAKLKSLDMIGENL